MTRSILFDTETTGLDPLTGDRQRGLSLASDTQATMQIATYTSEGPRTPRPMIPTDAEREAHAAFVAKLKEPVWNS